MLKDAVHDFHSTL